MRLAVAFPADPTGHDRALWWGCGALIFAVAVLIGLNTFYVLPVWDMAKEGNPATFFHSAILAALAMTLVVIGVRAVAPVRYPRLWLAGGFLFAYLAMDEAVEIHERVAMAVWKSIGIWDRILHYEITYALWEALFAPVFVLGGLILLTLIVSHRGYVRQFFWMGLAALGFWGLALILEFVGLTYLPTHKTAYSMAVFYEESFELVGSTLFLLGSVLIVRRLLGWSERRDGG